MLFRARMWLVVTAILVATGCNSASVPPRKSCYPVTGQLSVGGKPAAGATIVFHPEGGATEEWNEGFPRAQVQLDGSFALETYGDKDGAPAGNYKVLVTWTQGGNSEETEDTQMIDRLKGRYSDPTKTPLAAKVDAGPTELPPFKLP